jgi:thioredoxin 1
MVHNRSSIMTEKHKIKNTKKNLNDKIRHEDKTIVLFYASWCPFSKQFMPIFEEYAKSNPSERISMIVDDLPDLCKEYSIEYYPTVILFRKGKVQKRLDAQPGIGLNKEQLKEFIENP